MNDLQLADIISRLSSGSVEPVRTVLTALHERLRLIERHLGIAEPEPPQTGPAPYYGSGGVVIFPAAVSAPLPPTPPPLPASLAPVAAPPVEVVPSPKPSGGRLPSWIAPESAAALGMAPEPEPEPSAETPRG
jgi:hypothetical protein